MNTVQKEMKVDRHETSNQRAQFHEELRSIKSDVVQIKTETRAAISVTRELPVPLQTLVRHFTEHDRRLSLNEERKDQITGVLENVGPIVCLKINEAGLGTNLPRVVHVYSRIAARVQVQGFYGTLEKGGNKYAVMEDLGSASNLEVAIKNASLSKLCDKVRVAYELAITMAYLHQAGLLLKNLCDNTVFVRVVGGKPRPTITDLESARLV